MDRTQMISDFYNQADEDRRLCRSRQGQLEYRVTMHYIHRFLTEGARVLEIGQCMKDHHVSLVFMIIFHLLFF